MTQIQVRSLTSPVSRLCLALETYRRGDEGRIRGAKDFLDAFFPHDAASSKDEIFRHLPNEVRARVLTTWGLRGTKTALRDSDDKVQSVVHDALMAGDLDAAAFEEGLDATMVIRCVPLSRWWTFWRAGTPTKNVLGKALTTAYEVGLFDAKWLWETITRGDLRGTDAISEGLSKGDMVEWLRAVHVSGDGSPAGMLKALGWERLVARTPNEVLVPIIDALAKKIGLIEGEASAPSLAGAAASADGPRSFGTPSRPMTSPPPPSSETIQLEDLDDEPTHPPQPIPDALA